MFNILIIIFIILLKSYVWKIVLGQALTKIQALVWQLKNHCKDFSGTR